MGATGFDGISEVRWVRVADVMLPRQKSVANVNANNGMLSLNGSVNDNRESGLNVAAA